MSPNPDHALNPDRAKQLRENPDEYFKTAREWVAKYAKNWLKKTARSFVHKSFFFAQMDSYQIS